jgi:hypothetical protein
MARVEDEFFQQHLAVAERGLGLGARTDNRRSQIASAIDPPHAPPAAAGRRLDQHRKADASRSSQETVLVLRVAVIAWDRRNTGSFGDPFRLDFRAHARDCIRRRSDEDDPRFFAAPDKGSVLRQEAITGMNGIRFGLPGRLDNRVHIQIAGARRRRPDANGFAGGPNMRRVSIGI